MQRVLIVGPPGAGKSTLARALGRQLDLPVIHLDQLFWRPGWKRSDWDMFIEHVRAAAAEECWVMDGNYSNTYDLRFPRADTVIHLDVPTRTSLYRILRRMITGHGRVRSDGPEGCPERFDWPFIWWTITFHRLRRPRIIATLERFRDSVRVVTLRNSRAVAQFLRELDEPA